MIKAFVGATIIDRLAMEPLPCDVILIENGMTHAVGYGEDISNSKKTAKVFWCHKK